MTVAIGGGTGWSDDPAAHEQRLRFDEDQTVAELVPAEWASVELLDGLSAAVGLRVIVGLATDHSVIGVVDQVGDSWFTVRGPEALTLIASKAVTTVHNLPAFSIEPARDHRLRQSAVWRLWSGQRRYVRVRVSDGHTVGGWVRRVGRDFVELLEHPGDRVPELGDRSVVIPFAAVVSASIAGEVDA